MKFGSWLRERRKASGAGLKAFLEDHNDWRRARGLAPLPKQTLLGWEQGKRHPSVASVVPLLDYFGVADEQRGALYETINA